MSLFTNKTKGAEFSQDGKYRYKLWRIWDESKPKVMCIGLNPSTADADKDDATIRILKKMLSKLGYGGFYMMNCYPFVTSKPKLLQHNPASDEWNENMLTVTAYLCSHVIFAWGGFSLVKESGKEKRLLDMFPNALCFDKSKTGAPIHPLAMQKRNGRNPDNPELKFYNS